MVYKTERSKLAGELARLVSLFDFRRVSNINYLGSVVKQRNFARRRIFLSTDVSTRMREAKSRRDMDTAGVRVEIISLCIFTEL